ncbi:MAG: 50S ribosomal protein L5 [Acidimicrobiia bacterium]|nr:50S ribosomal protein L5 [bacterium]MXW68470.1 50S ribosomal protein L5 [Acidimicrobiia bacterium]MDE0673942.1 50S ribosomal protein L5 [bacterium]MXX00778.1 50S ribosomal protein L5 [Acidimicrobiia bacterium]MXX45351.1 50S ribosomal protein L5 [Acidimicrobiia bacterium]
MSRANGAASPRLKDRFRSEVAAALQGELGLANPMEVPRLEKIVVNMGIGEAVRDRKQVDNALSELELITGQRPRLNRARKSVAGFRIRKGMPVGVSVTLRGDRMWEFFDRVMSIAIPRVRDFRGMNPKSFDGRGNYSFGFDEQLVFPEIHYDQVSETRGMDVTICTTAVRDDHARAFLAAFGFPFRVRESLY